MDFLSNLIMNQGTDKFWMNLCFAPQMSTNFGLVYHAWTLCVGCFQHQLQILLHMCRHELAYIQRHLSQLGIHFITAVMLYKVFCMYVGLCK